MFLLIFDTLLADANDANARPDTVAGCCLRAGRSM
jgi:hypothetical protein